jgi:hypothetical protein
MLDMEDLAVMAAGLLLVTGGRRVAGDGFLPGVNDQTVSPAMLKLSQSAFEGGGGVHAVRASEPVQGPAGQDLVRVSCHRGRLHPAADARRRPHSRRPVGGALGGNVDLAIRLILKVPTSRATATFHEFSLPS